MESIVAQISVSLFLTKADNQDKKAKMSASNLLAGLGSPVSKKSVTPAYDSLKIPPDLGLAELHQVARVNLESYERRKACVFQENGPSAANRKNGQAMSLLWNRH